MHVIIELIEKTLGKKAIYNYTRGIAKQDELARELAQETFLKVYKNKDKLNSI